MNYDKIEALQEEYNQAETDDERGYIAAQLYCCTHDVGPAQLLEIIKEEGGSFSPEIDAGALRWCNDQLEPLS